MFEKHKRRRRCKIIALAAVCSVFLVLLFAWTEHTADETVRPPPSSILKIAVNTPRDPVVLAAGDIASCINDNDEATAQLIDNQDGTVLALGDTVYERGNSANYEDCYNPTWGRFKTRTRPALGNHEYETKDAAGYFAYFGSNAGEPPKGYYSFTIGSWHVVALNSNCKQTNDCVEDGKQLTWLRQDLAAHPATCTLAYMHHPVFSSGVHGASKALQPIWRTLAENGVDVLLVGHDHHYERFTPMNMEGTADQNNGMREFIVGTGGRSRYPIFRAAPNSEVATSDAFGVLRLILHARGYDWSFLPVADATFTDAGSDVCH